MANYCVRADLELIFGETNIAKWADANNNQNAEQITDRVTWACTRATNWINEKLLGTIYKIPFTTVPQSIIDLAAQLAGVLLYQSPRGLVDGGDSGAAMTELRDTIELQIAQIQSGQMQLDTKRIGVHAPGVVNVDE